MYIVFIIISESMYPKKKRISFSLPFKLRFLQQIDSRDASDAPETLENLFIRKENSATREFNSIRYILDTFHRHVHLELRLITHELTVMFGIHMVMQTIAFNILTVQLIKEIYNIIMKFNITSTYQTVINIFGSYIWITINVVKMIVFNLLCEEINGKVSPRSFQNFRKCMRRDNYVFSCC